MKKPSKPKTRPRVEVKIARQLLETLKAGGDARRRTIRKVKNAITKDCYENNLKMEVTLDRLLKELE